MVERLSNSTISALYHQHHDLSNKTVWCLKRTHLAKKQFLNRMRKHDRSQTRTPTECTARVNWQKLKNQVTGGNKTLHKETRQPLSCVASSKFYPQCLPESSSKFHNVDWNHQHSCLLFHCYSFLSTSSRCCIFLSANLRPTHRFSLEARSLDQTMWSVSANTWAACIAAASADKTVTQPRPDIRTHTQTHTQRINNGLKHKMKTQTTPVIFTVSITDVTSHMTTMILMTY